MASIFSAQLQSIEKYSWQHKSYTCSLNHQCISPAHPDACLRRANLSASVLETLRFTLTLRVTGTLDLLDATSLLIVSSCIVCRSNFEGRRKNHSSRFINSPYTGKDCAVYMRYTSICHAEHMNQVDHYLTLESHLARGQQMVALASRTRMPASPASDHNRNHLMCLKGQRTRTNVN